MVFSSEVKEKQQDILFTDPAFEIRVRIQGEIASELVRRERSGKKFDKRERQEFVSQRIKVILEKNDCAQIFGSLTESEQKRAMQLFLTEVVFKK